MSDPLQQLYDGLPNIICKGLCWDTCHRIPVAPIEIRHIAQVTNKRVKVDDLGPTLPTPSSPLRVAGFSQLRMRKGMCPYLRQRRCSIHQARPMICRLYGLVEGMRCPHGCQPDRELTDFEGHALFELLATLSNPA